MCGRYTITLPEEDILVRFQSIKIIDTEYRPRYNVAPSQSVPVIINQGENQMTFFKWGLVPGWSKDMKIGYKMINARSETLSQKPTFKHPFRRQRCIIPACGFYEWQKRGSGKQPYRIKMKDDSLFGFAGLWDRWESPEGEVIHSCTVITTSPNELMEPIHDRMPVILRPEDEKDWLDRSIEDTDILQDVLRPYDADAMEAYEVSPDVGSPKNQGAELIEAKK